MANTSLNAGVGAAGGTQARHISAPLPAALVRGLRAGDNVLLSGSIYTARDAAHARLAQLIHAGQPLPFALQGACIYYAGPTPAPSGGIIGAIGPTTAGRMDSFTPLLLQHGLRAMVGKGQRSQEVLDAICKEKAVYFGFIGGAGALAASCVTSCEVIAFAELGSEAIRRLDVKNFPLTVLADCEGNNLYKSGPAAFLQSL